MVATTIGWPPIPSGRPAPTRSGRSATSSGRTNWRRASGAPTPTHRTPRDHLAAARATAAKPAQVSRRHFAIFTSVTLLTRLLASTKLPSRVTSVLRTMLPPPGIAQLWNFSRFGSKRTTVFGIASDSLYQIVPLIAEMPYGADFGPLGDGHSVTAPVAGLRRPR